MNIAAWLDGLGLRQYEEAFRSNHIGWELLATLTSNDLREMGVASVGHRKRLLAAIAALAGPADATLLALVSERRQVTVMFVDLVGSTALASSLDPEEMSELLGAYQSVVLKELARFEGHLARFLGDGVLVYFGWPKAHEDAAERAVRSGLAIAAAVGRLSAPTGARLMARVGIATGLVVVGELVGKGAAREETVVGETPNLAARLQAVAEPAQVVIGDGTRRLLGALFELESLGPQLLKGISGPVPAFVVRGERASKSRFQARHADAYSPMVGRGPELALLLDCWRRAKAGEGGGVLLVGDAGIGKSRLSQALLDAMADEPHVRFHYQSSPLHTDSPLWPVVQQLTHAAGFEPDDEPGERLDKLEALLRQALDDVTGVTPLLASLLGIEVDGRYPPLDLALQQRRARTLEVLVGQLVGLASRQPLLALFEDVHWLDPTTRELIERALERIAASRVLLLLTSRPDEALAPAWRPAVTRLPLGRLATPQAMAIAECVAQGRTLPVECLERIVAKAEGVPLFVEELTRSLLEAELAGDSRVRVGMLPLAIPSTLQGSLIARLDRLASAKEVGEWVDDVVFGLLRSEWKNPSPPSRS